MYRPKLDAGNGMNVNTMHVIRKCSSGSPTQNTNVLVARVLCCWFVWKKLNTEIRFRMDILEHTGNIYKLILKSEWGIPAHCESRRDHRRNEQVAEASSETRPIPHEISYECSFLPSDEDWVSIDSSTSTRILHCHNILILHNEETILHPSEIKKFLNTWKIQIREGQYTQISLL